MSNVLNLSQIKNHPSRSAFPLESHRPFSAKAGELLPVYWRFGYPGDKWKLKHQHFTRTNPVNTAAYARFREYFDWYFVPLRLLNKNLQQSLTQIIDNPVQATSLLKNKNVTLDIPYATTLALFGLCSLMTGSSVDPVRDPVLNFFGFKTSALSFKLLRYLQYGNIIPPHATSPESLGYSSNMEGFTYFENPSNVNLLPLFAYQKIYNDYFRFQQWEKSQPFTYNFDYYTGGNIIDALSQEELLELINSNNFLTLRYANWNKDRFMGILPNSQLGDIASIETASATSANVVFVNETASRTDPVSGTLDNSSNLTLKVPSSSTPGTGSLKAALSSSINAIQLRIMEATQRYREISMCSGQNYVDQIEAHWDAKLSRSLSDQCIYIGGSSSNINISEVVNTALIEQSPADIRGKGIGSGQSNEIFSFNEHGILMCIYHCVPLIDYTVTGHRSDLLWTSVQDFPQPEFDRIGLQTTPFLEFFDSDISDHGLPPSLPTKTMGYLPRFYSEKMDYDTVLGAFETTLKNWVITLSPDYLGSWFAKSVQSGVLNYAFFKVNPSVCDTIFAVAADSSVDTDQFLIDAFFDVSVVRNFDYDGMPY